MWRAARAVFHMYSLCIINMNTLKCRCASRADFHVYSLCVFNDNALNFSGAHITLKNPGALRAPYSICILFVFPIQIGSEGTPNTLNCFTTVIRFPGFEAPLIR